jgi:hypothetical protein
MRLLQCDDGKVSLTKDFVGAHIPAYAILSHTWGLDSEEVTYQDLVNGSGKDKAGYKKIWFCANQAQQDGLMYFWIDTCCIDKGNNTELAEAINSMFRWYRKAARCYVYLSDVSTAGCESGLPPSSLPSWEPAFRRSRWFTRGWTLQELLAPASVQFFALDGTLIGDKTSLQQQIYEITSIAVSALQGEPLSSFGVDERFGWAESRQTTREEDWAYSLLGIFDVFISPIYGEGKANAVRRLRSKINGASGRMPVPSSSRTTQADWKPGKGTLQIEVGTMEDESRHLLHTSQSRRPRILRSRRWNIWLGILAILALSSTMLVDSVLSPSSKTSLPRN